MWILVLFLLGPTVTGEAAIQGYSTEKKCESERVRIMDAMKEVYPGDQTFELKCKFYKLGET